METKIRNAVTKKTWCGHVEFVYKQIFYKFGNPTKVWCNGTGPKIVALPKNEKLNSLNSFPVTDLQPTNVVGAYVLNTKMKKNEKK